MVRRHERYDGDIVVIIKFRMNKCCGDCGCSFQIKIRSYAMEVTNVIEAGSQGRNLIAIYIGRN